MLRRRDVWSIRILLASALQLAAGTVIVFALAAQAPTIQDYINQNNNDRLRSLEGLRIDQRLTLLEKIATDQAAAEESRSRLMYGILGGVLTSLLVHAIQIKGQYNRRRERE